MTIGLCRLAQEQTISQPYTVAFMCQEARLTADDKVLEIGTGSGYCAAVLSLLAHEVHTVERHRGALPHGTRRLARLRLHERALLLGRWHARPAAGGAVRCDPLHRRGRVAARGLSGATRRRRPADHPHRPASRASKCTASPAAATSSNAKTSAASASCRSSVVSQGTDATR